MPFEMPITVARYFMKFLVDEIKHDGRVGNVKIHVLMEHLSIQ
jgi:hypothetical protein